MEEQRVLVVSVGALVGRWTSAPKVPCIVQALDYVSGRLLWQSEVELGSNMAHSVPTLLATLGQLFIAFPHVVLAIDVATGAGLWRSPNANPGGFAVGLALPQIAAHADLA